MGIITKGLSMGRAYLKNQASKKGTTKLQYPVIKSVPVSKTVKKEGVEASVKKTKSDAYLKNITEINKHRRAVTEGEKSKKKIQHMVDTKRAYHIGKPSSSRAHASDPGKKKQIGAD